MRRKVSADQKLPVLMSHRRPRRDNSLNGCAQVSERYCNLASSTDHSSRIQRRPGGKIDLRRARLIGNEPCVSLKNFTCLPGATTRASHGRTPTGECG